MSNEVTVILRVVKEGSADLKAFSDDLKGVGTAAQSNKGAFDELGKSVTGFIVAYAGVKGLAAIGEMIALGDSANRAEATFRQLSSSIGNYQSIMTGLRSATMGVVNDMDLQAGANKLLSMNLVDSQEQMEKFMTIATRLGGAMGKSSGEAIDNFALMLSNQSLLRLDTYGISAANVRARMNELSKEFPEMDKQARFLQATLEQGDIALNRLGMSAEAAATPLARLQVAMTNFGQDFAQNLSTGFNALMGIVEYTAGALPQQIAQIQQTNAEVSDVFKSVVSGMDISGDNLNPVAQFIDQAIVDVKNDPSLAGDAKALMERVFGEMNTNADDMMKQGNLAFSDMFNDMSNSQVFEQLTVGVLQYKNALGYAAAAATDLATSTNEVGSAILGGADSSGVALPAWMGGGAGATASGFSSQQAALDAMQQQRERRAEDAGRKEMMAYYNGASSMWTRHEGGMSAAYFAASEQLYRQQAEHQKMLEQGNANQELGQFNMDAGAIGQYATRETADSLAAAFERISAAHDKGLISDEDLSKAKDLRDSVEKAADAFEKMRLSDVFGQTGGGMAGEMSDMVIRQMKAAGKSDAEIEAAQQAFNMGSGRETELSTKFKNEIVPQLASMNPQQAAEAMNNLQTFMQQAQLQGLTPDQIAKGLPLAMGYQQQAGAGGQFTIKPGQSAGEIMSQTGMTLPELLAATGAKNARLIPTGTFGNMQGFAPTQGFDINQLIAALIGGSMPKLGGSTGLDNAGTPLGVGFGAGMGGTAAKGGDQKAAVDTASKAMQDMVTRSSLLDSNMSSVATSFTTSASQADAIRTAIDNIPDSKTVEVTVKVNDPDGALKLGNAAMGALNGGGNSGQSTVTKNTITSSNNGGQKKNR